MSGSMTHSAADVTRQLLIDLGYGSDTTGTAAWPVYCSYQPKNPDSVIATIDTEGVHEGRLMVDGEVQERLGVQIVIRSARFDLGWIKAREIAVGLDAVLRVVVLVDSSSYKIHAFSRTSGPLPLGDEAEDEGGGGNVASKRKEFSINTTVSLRQTS